MSVKVAETSGICWLRVVLLLCKRWSNVGYHGRTDLSKNKVAPTVTGNIAPTSETTSQQRSPDFHCYLGYEPINIDITTMRG